MFFPLPAQTVLEAKAKSRRNTRLLFFVLASIYALCAHLIYLCFVAQDGSEVAFNFFQGLPLSLSVAFGLAAFHFWWAWKKPLSAVLPQLGAVPADPKDQLHKQFIDIVREVELAIGSKELQTVVIPSGGCNAFSIEDKDGRGAIGVTEGLLAKLNRAELSAVVAHEAAHLAHDDSRLITIACSLFSVFDSICSMMMPSSNPGVVSWRIRRRGGGNSSGVALVILIAFFGKLMTRLISMAISRNREYMADSHAVDLCKDPLSLASALHKISSAYRGSLQMPEGFSAVFIMNPSHSALDETQNLTSDLFSTHPPAASRISKLKQWAHADLRKNAPTPPSSNQLYYQAEGQWKGPLSSPEALKNQSDLTPLTWIAGEDLTQASMIPELLQIFNQNLQGPASSFSCPRCRVFLRENLYEGTRVLDCPHCQGTLLQAEALARILVRRFKRFTAEEIQEAKSWHILQKGTLDQRSPTAPIGCPACQQRMFKSIYTESTRVVVDRCTNDDCRMIWCDPGELTRIQALVEHPPHSEAP